MDPEAFLAPEVGVAVALSMLVTNKHVQRAARSVLVRGLAAAMGASAAVKTFAQGFNPASAAGAAMQDLKDEAQAVHGGKTESPPARHSARKGQHAEQA